MEIGKTREPVGDHTIIENSDDLFSDTGYFTTRDEPLEKLTPLDLQQEAFALLCMGEKEAATGVAWSALHAEIKAEKNGRKSITTTARKIRLLLARCGVDMANEVDPRIDEIRNIRSQIRSGVSIEEVDFNVRSLLRGGE